MQEPVQGPECVCVCVFLIVSASSVKCIVLHNRMSLTASCGYKYTCCHVRQAVS